MYFSSFKDKNLVMLSKSFFRVIREIWDIGYVIFKVLLFKCKWINTNSGEQINELEFTQIDLRKTNYMNELFTMTSQAKQFFNALIILKVNGQLFYEKNTFMLVMKIKI